MGALVISYYLGILSECSLQWDIMDNKNKDSWEREGMWIEKRY